MVWREWHGGSAFYMASKEGKPGSDVDMWMSLMLFSLLKLSLFLPCLSLPVSSDNPPWRAALTECPFRSEDHFFFFWKWKCQKRHCSVSTYLPESTHCTELVLPRPPDLALPFGQVTSSRHAAPWLISIHDNSLQDNPDSGSLQGCLISRKPLFYVGQWSV